MVLDPYADLLEEVWTSARQHDGGQLATYIPQLATVDPGVFGLAVATTDGHVYRTGRLEPFTIQSVSKPFAYALALADRGSEPVLSRVGLEPTGNAFNSISVDASGRPHNPMVNAGAIVTTSLVGGDTPEAQLERVVSGLSAFAGRLLVVDEEVYRSEHETGDRNRAIAYLLRSTGSLADDADAALALYFRQCSLVVTAADLAVMAATLAAGGTNPVTGEQVVSPQIAGRVLTVMSTCGMYDFAGEWLHRVGLPAKSGVSGGIAAVQPGRLGIGAHSPLLDPRGNSVRGIAACEELSERLGLHVFSGGSVDTRRGHRTRREDVVRSKRVRVAGELAVLATEGHRVVLHELAGRHDAATVERLVREVVDDPAGCGWLALDLRRVTALTAPAADLLSGLVRRLAADGVQVVVVQPQDAAVRRTVADVAAVADHAVADADDALRWCEDALLVASGLPAGPPEGLVPLAGQDLLAGLTAAAVAALEAVSVTRVYTPGSLVFSQGAAPDGLYFLAAGQVSAVVRTATGSTRRLATMGPGSAFGELGLLDGSPRSTGIVVDEPTLCHVVTQEAFERLVAADPAAGVELHRAIAAASPTGCAG